MKMAFLILTLFISNSLFGSEFTCLKLAWTQADARFLRLVNTVIFKHDSGILNRDQIVALKGLFFLGKSEVASNVEARLVKEIEMLIEDPSRPRFEFEAARSGTTANLFFERMISGIKSSVTQRNDPSFAVHSALMIAEKYLVPSVFSNLGNEATDAAVKTNRIILKNRLMIKLKLSRVVATIAYTIGDSRLREREYPEVFPGLKFIEFSKWARFKEISSDLDHLALHLSSQINEIERYYNYPSEKIGQDSNPMRDLAVGEAMGFIPYFKEAIKQIELLEEKLP